MMLPTKGETAPNIPVAAGTGQSLMASSIIPSADQKDKSNSVNAATGSTSWPNNDFWLTDLGGGLKGTNLSGLLDVCFPPRVSIVSGLLVEGTYLFAGTPKIGKSFFCYQMGYCVSMGLPFLGRDTTQSDVLYLAMEDKYPRLQTRALMMFGEDGSERLMLAEQCKTLSEGLLDQLNAFIHTHPDARLIIMDTLACIRSTTHDCNYSVDYRDLKAIQQFSSDHHICILLVHHTRKAESSDPFDRLSGTNGLLGAVDGALILQRANRIEGDATLDITGRDISPQQLTLRPDANCVWTVTSDSTGNPLVEYDPLIISVAHLLTADMPMWTGTASELMQTLDIDPSTIRPNVLTRRLNGLCEQMAKLGIDYSFHRNADARFIHLSYHPPQKAAQ